MVLNSNLLKIHYFLFLSLALLLLSCEPDIKLDKLPNGIILGSVTDIEGNEYRTLKIGDQEWMIDNLRTTKYNDGTEIPNISDSLKWASQTEGACCNYNNNAANSRVYGKLYNWHAIDDMRGIAPAGWHIPSETDWNILIQYLVANGYSTDNTTNSGQIAKAMASTLAWNANDGVASIGNNLSLNNKSGFSALPAGFRFPNGEFMHKGNFTFWWSNNYDFNAQVFVHGLSSINPTVINSVKNKLYGFSIRCVKDVAIDITTMEPSEIYSNSVLLSAKIEALNDISVIARGFCWSINPNPDLTYYWGVSGYTTDGSGLGIFSTTINGLLQNTNYYIRAYATTESGTLFGNEITFKTKSTPTLPTVTTQAISSVTDKTAVGGGNVTSDGNVNLIARGICWSTTNTQPSINYDSKTVETGNAGVFSSTMTNLTPNTNYYVRAYATNNLGTAYGNVVTFKTSAAVVNYGSVTDVDGNVYKTVVIGTQTWMAENLRTTKYRDNSPITQVTNLSLWNSQTAGAYNNYPDNPSLSQIFGLLYNGYAVTDSRKIAPTGWHVATNADWETLKNYSGSDAALKLREAGSTNWHDGYNGTDNYGFKALPGGICAFAPTDVYQRGFWWTSDGSWAWTITTLSLYNYQAVSSYGLSVRCVKD